MPTGTTNYTPTYNAATPTVIPYNPNTYPGGYAPRSYTYNSPMGGTYESSWSPEYVASLRPSGTVGGASGSYGGGSFSMPTFSQFAGTDLTSLLSNIMRLRTQAQEPILREQSRQFDVTSGLRGTELANQLALGQGNLSNALRLGEGSLSNELTLGQGNLSNQAAQIANALALGQGNLALQNRSQALTEREYADAQARSNQMLQWLMAALQSPQTGNAALYALTRWRENPPSYPPAGGAQDRLAYLSGLMNMPTTGYTMMGPDGTPMGPTRWY